LNRVAALAVDLANAAGFAPDAMADLERAAILHEVARSVIPETILWKPGELSNDEWAILRREPELGSLLFARTPFLAPAAAVIAAMRERFDGSGYPKGTAAGAIPPGARVLALADAYDTMRRPRGHREPMTQDEAAEEVREGRGTQFDPDLADVLLAIVARR